MQDNTQDNDTIEIVVQEQPEEKIVEVEVLQEQPQAREEMFEGLEMPLFNLGLTTF